MPLSPSDKFDKGFNLGENSINSMPIKQDNDSKFVNKGPVLKMKAQ